MTKSLDPIVSLTVSMAESPGSVALILGSGVSRDAGAPTASDVVADLRRKLYVVQPEHGEPTEQELATWLADEGYSGLGYSELLELLAPNEADRQSLMASYFDDLEPGRTHKLLAELAHRGLIKVFITTNFDPLLERALAARGIEATVVTNDHDLRVAIPREQCAHFIIKPHGHHLQQTIRNTDAELAELPKGVSSELEEIVNRYGVLLLGYSGSDPAIRRILETRKSRYGLWWQTRGEARANVAEILRSTGGRSIVRSSAAELLSDLDHGLLAFERQPSGQTPSAVNDQVLGLLRRRDGVGLDELLRSERAAYELALTDTAAANRHRDAGVPEVAPHLLSIVERRIASYLPLALHDVDRLRAQIETDIDYLEAQEPVSGAASWMQIPVWGSWCAMYVVGALAIKSLKWDALKPLLQVRYSEPYREKPTSPLRYHEISHHMGIALGPQPRAGKTWTSPAWEFLRQTMLRPWLVERYPEIGTSERFTDALAQFDLLAGIALGLDSEQRFQAVHWSMSSKAPARLARRIASDPSVQRKVAEIVGIPTDGMHSQIADALDRNEHIAQPFPDTELIDIIRSGKAPSQRAADSWSTPNAT